ncbi:MAG: hypothetical protein KF764_10510 [Labilithrix sp.]|nr:hypothetical protein [Labilithrix sp.]
MTFGRRNNPGTDALAQQRREAHTNEIAGRLGALPFLGGQIFKDVSLPGIRGRVRAIAGTTLTLWRPEDARSFVAGQVIEAAATDGELGAKRAGKVTIANANVAAGTVTATADWPTGIPALALDDYLFGEREFGPPVESQNGVDWSAGSVRTLVVPGVRQGAVVVLASHGPRPAILRTIFARLRDGATLVAIESRFATTADLLVY